jgi:hypothetical protein
MQEVTAGSLVLDDKITLLRQPYTVSVAGVGDHWVPRGQKGVAARTANCYFITPCSRK